MPLLVAIFLGILLSVASGGKLKLLEESPLKRPVVLIALFVIQGLSRGRLATSGVGMWSIPIWGAASLVLSYVAFLTRTRGLAILACGTLLNLVVVLLNGYMPVVLWQAGSDSALGAGATAGFYRIAGTSSVATWLGDVLPMRLFSWTYYLSSGDVLLAIGAIVFLLEVTTASTLDSAGNPSTGAVRE